MNRLTYLLFVVFILLVTQINVFAQTDQVALDTSVTDGSLFFDVQGNRVLCPDGTSLGGSWNCQRSQKRYSTREIAYGCLCTQKIGNTLKVGFRLLSPTDRGAHAKVRLRSDSWDSSVVQGPTTWGSYSYVNYTHPNI